MGDKFKTPSSQPKNMLLGPRSSPSPKARPDSNGKTIDAKPAGQKPRKINVDVVHMRTGAQRSHMKLGPLEEYKNATAIQLAPNAGSDHVVERTAANPLGPSSDQTSKRNAAVRKNIAAVNPRIEKLANEALDRMAPADRKKAEAVRRAIAGDDGPAKTALNTLLAEGKLTTGESNKNGRKLLDALHDVQQRSNRPPYFLGDVIQEVVDPTSIGQESRGTCAAATAQTLLARSNPAEYVRLVGDLVTQGKTSLMDGTTVKAAPGILPVPSKSANSSNRTDSSVAFQDSMTLHFSKGERLEGLKGGEFDAMLEAVTGRKWDKSKPEGLGLTFQKAVQWTVNRHFGDDMVGPLTRAYEKGARNIPFSFLKDNVKHAVLLTEIRKSPSGERNFVFIDPQGQQSSLKESQLRQNITAVHTPGS